jgi:cytosine/adenosine deaminase-related metal-dependent hydrolase
MFRDLWDTLGHWADPVDTHPGSPIQFAQAVGLLDYPTLLAHVNYCPDDDLARLAAGRASVVYCPRTHAYFGHPPHRFRDMVRAGVNVAIGTDSCASSPDLNPLDDVRLVHRLYPELPPGYLVRLVTASAAQALQLQDSVGTLIPGKRADVIALPVRTNDPMRELLESDVRPDHVWIDGARVL